MRRATLTQRTPDGERTLKGWGAEIDGVPVVILRAGRPERGRGCWQVFEPTVGKQVCGTWGDTRDAVLASATERVGKMAECEGISAGQLLRRVIAEHVH